MSGRDTPRVRGIETLDDVTPGDPNEVESLPVVVAVGRTAEPGVHAIPRPKMEFVAIAVCLRQDSNLRKKVHRLAAAQIPCRKSDEDTIIMGVTRMPRAVVDGCFRQPQVLCGIASKQSLTLGNTRTPATVVLAQASEDVQSAADTRNVAVDKALPSLVRTEEMFRHMLISDGRVLGPHRELN